MITIETQGLVDPQKPFPINISPALDLLRTRQDPYSVRLLDALIQINQMFMVLWNAVRSPDEILMDSYTVQNSSGKDIVSLGPNANQDGQLQVLAAGSSPNVATLVPDKFTITTAQGTLKLDLSANPVLVEFVPAGGAILQVKLPTGSQVMVNGNQVLTDRQPTVTAVSATIAQTAGATYTATEQAMLNDLKTLALANKTAVNAVIARLQTMGIIT